MKTIPQNFGNAEQKETKLAKVCVFRPSFIRVNSHDLRARTFCGGAPGGRALPALIFILLSLFSSISFAQTPDNVAEREVQRRQAAIPQGEAALARGKTAMKAKNYTLANEEFKTAV